MNKSLLLLQLALLLLLAPAPAPAQCQGHWECPFNPTIPDYDEYYNYGRSMKSVKHAPPAAHSQPKTKHYLVGFLMTSFSK